MPWRFKIMRLVVLLGLSFVVCSTIWNVALVPGVPAFQHDWLWPVDASQFRSFAFEGATPWQSSGIGSPAVYPSGWWPYILAGAACTILGAHAAFVFVIALAVAISYLASYRLMQLLSFGQWASVAAAMIYSANPLVLNEIQAGHWIYLLAFALLPLIAGLAFRGTGWRSALSLGVLLGLSAAQIQFLAMGAIVALTFACARQERSKALIRVSFAIVVALVFSMPEWILGVLDRTPVPMSAYAPYVHWEAALSSDISHTVRLLGYIGGYDAKLLPTLTQQGLFVLPFLSLLSVAICRSRVAVACAFLGCFAIVLASGLNGPLAPYWIAGFQSFRPLSIFREFYHLLALAVLAYSVLCGMLCNQLAQKERVARVSSCICSILLVWLAGSS